MRQTNLIWQPIAKAPQYLRPRSEQIVALYRPSQDVNECYLEYSTSNPDFASSQNATDAGYTEFALLVDE